MCRILLATLAICLIAVPASAAKFVAVQDVNTGIEPMAKATSQCRIPNLYGTASNCTSIFWSFGGWCLQDEVTGYFPLQNDACLAGCGATGGNVKIEAGEMGLRVVGTTCNGGYPVTTFPAEGVFSVFAPDPVLSTPDCPVPSYDPLFTSVVTTVPALTATASSDPARSYNVVCAITSPANVIAVQPVFGSFQYVSFSVPESSIDACGNGGITACAWWYPGFRGRNGEATGLECAVPCTQYWRNVGLYGPDWYESIDAGLGRQADFAMWLDATCATIAVKNTTWGKLKSLMNN